MSGNSSVDAVRGFALAAFLLAAALPARAHLDSDAAPVPGDLRAAGAVSLPVSCKPAVQAEFNRAVALLHSFFYEEARNVFGKVAGQDPDCAMAQWGIAQTWWHPIWTPPTADEMSAGRAAAAKAMAMKSTPRERAFIEAIDAYYETPEPAVAGPAGQACHGPLGPRERVVAYEQAMKKALDASPKDLETRVFHAFAVLSVGYATPLDTTRANQKAAGATFEALWKQHPKHPGLAHYIIHSYDYPDSALRALPAAKAYASIAPWVPHALHMPSHIFTRLGMWDEAIASNAAAAEAARGYASLRQRSSSEAEELHAIDYMIYSYLQQGRDGEARRAVDAVNAVQAIHPEFEFSGSYALASIPARYALERSDWAEAAALQVPSRPQWARFPFVEGLFEYAHALGRARTGDLEGARAAIARMRELQAATTEPRFDYFKKHLDVQVQAASAWLAHAEGRDAEAVAALRAAADAEDALGKHPVTPGALMPVREQLGEMLLLLKQPKDALAAYEAGLKIYPARFNSLYGAAQAAEQSGNDRVARRHYAELARQAAKGDPARAGVAHARQFLAAR